MSNNGEEAGRPCPPNFTEDELSGNNIQKIKYSQWLSLPDGNFVPSLETADRLPEGLYELKYDGNYNNIKLVKKDFKLDELYELPSKEIEGVLKDIRSFWDKRELFKKYNFIHKRGILLYGDPGCGKSAIIQLCISQLIKEKKGIAINIKNTDDVENYTTFISTIRQIEKDRPFIIILEDIDSIMGGEKYTTSQVLNILDGIKQINDVVHIATTNYPDRLEERILNRPSRFDRRYKVSAPSDTVRRTYFINKIGSDFVDLELWVEETKGMSLAHLRELVVSVIVLGNSFEETINTLKELKHKPKLNNGESSVGFVSSEED